jgi:lipopolysaccharide transport system ATP-binding protein
MAFQAKCVARIRKMQEAGVTLLFVSHSPTLVEDFCDRAIMLHKGVLMMEGAPNEVMEAYRESLAMTPEDVQAAATVG